MHLQHNNRENQSWRPRTIYSRPATVGVFLLVVVEMDLGEWDWWRVGRCTKLEDQLETICFFWSPRVERINLQLPPDKPWIALKRWGKDGACRYHDSATAAAGEFPTRIKYGFPASIYRTSSLFMRCKHHFIFTSQFNNNRHTYEEKNPQSMLNPRPLACISMLYMSCVIIIIR